MKNFRAIISNKIKQLKLKPQDLKRKKETALKLKQKKKSFEAHKQKYRLENVPEGAIALPFNHIITINNAHALYRSFKAIGQDCVLIDMSGGALLKDIETSGLFDKNNKYLFFDYEDNEGLASGSFGQVNYSPTISDISIFTQIGSSFFLESSQNYGAFEHLGEDSFLEQSYISFEEFFKKNEFKIPIRVLEKDHFAETLSRYWLVSMLARLDAGEAELSKAFKQGWALVGKYLNDMVKLDIEAQCFEAFITKHKFSRAIHFCGPYTLAGASLKYSLDNVALPCALFHDAFMPPEQMKKINSNMPNFLAKKSHIDILYKNRSDQPAYELKNSSDMIPLRYPIRTWASYDLVGLPQDYLWATWMEYPHETVCAKNNAIINKFEQALEVKDRIPLVGNPLLESGDDIPSEIHRVLPNIIVSVAPDIFSAVRFESTIYLTDMQAYYAELETIIKSYKDVANIIIALHPRLTPNNPHYGLMSSLGTVAAVSTGELLPYADLFISYVGSVMNFDAEDLGIPIVALSLYDDAKSYSQNSFDFKNMVIIETKKEMKHWLELSSKVTKRNNKKIPKLGTTAQKFLEVWK